MPTRALRRCPFILAMVLLIPGLAGADDVRVRSAVANVRAEGSTQGRVLFQVKAGETLRLIDTAGDWFHVETSDGRRGFVSKTVVEVVASVPVPTAAPPAPPASPAAALLSIDHKDVGCVVGDRYPRLDACFLPPGDLGSAKVLFRAGDGPWYSVDWMAEGGCYVAYLPKPLATTTEIQYYVAAVDKSFNERQRPDRAPETAYHARVVRNQGECDPLTLVANSVKKVAKPIVVAMARTGGAPAIVGALLVGFSQEGVILATAAVAGAAGGAAAAGAGAGAGSGGGIGSGTLAVAGGAVAAGALVAVVAAGGGGEETPECSANQIVANSGGAIVATNASTICTAESIPCSRGVTLRTCLGGVCTSSCNAHYLLSDGRQFSCGTVANCFSGASTAITDPNFCLSAAQQALQACQ